MHAPSLRGRTQRKWIGARPILFSLPLAWTAVLVTNTSTVRQAPRAVTQWPGLTDLEKGSRAVPVSLCLPMGSVGFLGLPT